MVEVGADALWARDQAPGRDTPRFVFLHGLGGTHRYWTCAGPVVPGAVYLDLLGFGDSPRPLARYTVDRHLAALRGVLAGGQRYILVGHSLGAALALAYAARYPEDVDGLVLISPPHYGGRRRAFRWMRRHPRGWVSTNMLVTAAACVVTRRALGRLMPRLLRTFPREVAEDLVKHNMMSSTTSLWNVLYRRNLTEDAATLPEWLPVLCIHGTADTTAPVDGARRLAADRANWRLALLPGVDHHPWLRAPEACAALLAEMDRTSHRGGSASAVRRPPPDQSNLPS